MLIGLNGRKQAGKDTVCERATHIMRDVMQVERVSFADPLYESAAAALGVSVELLRELKTDDSAYVAVMGDGGIWTEQTVREYLQRYGTEAHRNVFGTDFWVEQARLNDHAGRIVMVTDCRFPNEAAAVREAGGWVVQVVGPREVENTGDAHPSEAPLPAEVIDGTIFNDVRDDGFRMLDGQVSTLLRLMLHRERALA